MTSALPNSTPSAWRRRWRNEGYKPYVAIYSTFLQRAYDQIVHDVGIGGLPVRFAVDRAGLVSDDGPTHQGVFDVGFLKSVPGMTVCSPGDREDLVRMLELFGCGYGAVCHPLSKGRRVRPQRTAWRASSHDTRDGDDRRRRK